MSGFRRFLRTLKPGEIGFVIASLGALSASILTASSLQQAAKQKEYERAQQWKKRIADVKHLVSEGTPVEGLSTIKFKKIISHRHPNRRNYLGKLKVLGKLRGVWRS